MPELFEAITKDPKYQPFMPELLERVKSNLMVNAVMREAILSDTANALGKMHDVVVDAAKPALIGREIIWVLPTTETLVRFPKTKLGKAHRTAELSQVWITQEKYDTVDIKADMEIKAGAGYSKKFFETASWGVMERQTGSRQSHRGAGNRKNLRPLRRHRRG